MENKIKASFEKIFGASSPIHLTDYNIPESLIVFHRVTNTTKATTKEAQPSIPHLPVQQNIQPKSVISEVPSQVTVDRKQKSNDVQIKPHQCHFTELSSYECPVHDFKIPDPLSPLPEEPNVHTPQKPMPEAQPSNEINKEVQEIQSWFMELFGCHTPVRIQDYGISEEKPVVPLSTSPRVSIDTEEKPAKINPTVPTRKKDKRSSIELFGPLTPEYSPDHHDTPIAVLSNTGNICSIPDPTSDQVLKSKNREIRKAKQQITCKSTPPVAEIEQIDDGLPARPPTPRCFLDQCDEQNENWKKWFDVPFSDPSKESAARLIDRRYSEIFQVPIDL